MTAIDRAAPIEAAAVHQFDAVGRICSCGALCGVACDGRTFSEHVAEATLPVIARELLAPLRELHADHECGNYDQAFWCFAPYRDGRCVKVGICSHCGDKAPCPTVQLLDQIESDAKGDE